MGEFDHPRCYDTIEYVAKCCREAGKPWGILAQNPAYARRWVERGARMLVFSSDVWALRAGLESLRDTFSEFLEV
jgi:2-keto-3-deoxy-L-rhamnonate aldolase RhmA